MAGMSVQLDTDNMSTKTLEGYRRNWRIAQGFFVALTLSLPWWYPLWPFDTDMSQTDFRFTVAGGWIICMFRAQILGLTIRARGESAR